MEFFKKQNRSRGLVWLFGFINLNFTVPHRGPKYNSPAAKRGLADASFGFFGKFQASLGFAREILRGLEKTSLHLRP